MQNVFERVDSNRRKSAIVMVAFSLVVGVSVYFISMGLGAYLGSSSAQGYGGFGIFGIALIFSGVTSFGGYWFSDRIILTLSAARPAGCR